MKMQNNERIIKISIILTFIIILGFLIKAFLINSKAIYDGIFVLLLLTIAFLNHKKLRIKVYSIILAEVFFIFHMLGTLGWYDIAVFGIPYDKILHFYGPLVLFIFSFNYLSKFKLRLNHALVIALLVTLGINAIQEVVEFTGNTLLGKGDGIFFYGSGDIGGEDTPKDLIANLLGGTLGLVIMYFIRNIKK